MNQNVINEVEETLGFPVKPVGVSALIGKMSLILVFFSHELSEDSIYKMARIINGVNEKIKMKNVSFTYSLEDSAIFIQSKGFATVAKVRDIEKLGYNFIEARKIHEDLCKLITFRLNNSLTNKSKDMT